MLIAQDFATVESSVEEKNGSPQAGLRQEEYKTLEIRYKRLENIKASEVVVDDVEYKCFRSKRDAVSYYYVVKENSPNVVIYYVHSIEEKQPEVFTFRVTTR